MIKGNGSIQARMGRTLGVVCSAIAILSGLSLYSISAVKNALSESASPTNSSFMRLNVLRDGLEDVIAAAQKSPEVMVRARANFNSQADRLQKIVADRPWFEEFSSLRRQFSATETLGKELAVQKLIGLREIFGRLATADLELERKRSISALEGLWYLMLFVTLLALLMPAVSMWLTGRTINQDLLGFTRSLLHFSEQNDQTSESMRDASQNLSSASAEQSAAVQQTVASIAEIRSMLAQTATFVREVQGLTPNVNDKSNSGRQTMARMEAAMISIEQANSQLEAFVQIIQSIREKTHVINDIVFKTQLLSFNASIEAARAGQYGRGFAVVAEEVGKLAQLSGGAAKDIDQLLSDSQRRVIQIVEAVQGRVVEGKDVSEEALKRFGEIAGQINIIAEKINQVGEATQEQESGVEQTARAMDQMDSTAVDAKKAADQIFKIAEKVRLSSVKIRETAGAIQVYVREVRPASRARAKAAPTEDNTVDLVARITQKKMSADDPSFRKTGE